MKRLPENLKFAAVLTGLIFLTVAARSQSIIGTWQLVKETTCLENEITSSGDSTEMLIDQMKGMGSAGPQIIQFREKGWGEESTRILNKKKSANNKNFLYKFNGEMLLILDKKSQTIAESFTVDTISADSLILSNTARACETRVFVKIKEPKSN